MMALTWPTACVIITAMFLCIPALAIIVIHLEGRPK
jgi:hypothetical protein